MRWQHPDRGLIPPSEFIPLAEENGLILELGRWILEMACHQTKAWQDEAGRPDLTVSVNLSGRQIADGDLVGDVARALAASGLDPACLTLEITESVLVRDIEATVAAFRALKSLGIRLAIDDFGTGYSSLSYLRQFPIDILKIDQSFVASLDEGTDSSALVRSILNLSATLQLETVAEGIETAEQRSALESLGANHGQGYLFARPMSSADLGSLLAVGGTSVAATGPSGGAAPPTHPPSRRRAAGLRASHRRSHHATRGSTMTPTTQAPARTAPPPRMLLLGVVVAAIAGAALLVALRPTGLRRASHYRSRDAQRLRRHWCGDVHRPRRPHASRRHGRARPAIRDMPAHVHPGTCADLTPQPKFPLENVRDGRSTTDRPCARSMSSSTATSPSTSTSRTTTSRPTWRAWTSARSSLASRSRIDPHRGHHGGLCRSRARRLRTHPRPSKSPSRRRPAIGSRSNLPRSACPRQAR